MEEKSESTDVQEEEEEEEERDELLHSNGTLSHHLQLINHITDTSENLRMDFYASRYD